jgi:putative FmdB family regulatory protein
MPIYEFKCDKCGSEKELIVKFNDPAPECCGQPMHHEISKCSFHLKGSGWYVTDYTNKSRGSSDKTSSSGSETKESSTSTSSDVPADTD